MKYIFRTQQTMQHLLPLRFFSKGQMGLFLICVSLLSACAASSAKTRQSVTGMKQAVPVTIATVTQKTVPVQLQVIGNVQAYNTVTVRAQVGGELTGVYFRQGQKVKKGQLLFTIDDRPLSASLQQAQATLAKDIAQVRQAQANVAKDLAQEKYAQAQARSYSTLGNQGAISQVQAAQYVTNAQSAAATVAADRAAVQNAQAAVNADRAAVQNAQVQLSYTKIYSPIDGQAGTVIVDRGNLIQANSTNPLVTISQIRPVQVAFSLPERELPAVRKYMGISRLTLQAIVPNAKQPPVSGVLTAVNGVVDNTTGTIQLLGDFANTQEHLWPGQFVNVVLNLTSQPNAITVPSQAVQTGQNGQSVFVLKPNNTVESRAVTVSRTFNGQAVIARGLQPGEKVVTDGQFNLIPGAKVQVKTAQLPVRSAS
jgi:multidrug efflux system membrane fusion protein